MLCFAYAAHILAKLFCSKGKRTRTSSKLLSQNRVRVVVINNKRQSRDSYRAAVFLYKLFCFNCLSFFDTSLFGPDATTRNGSWANQYCFIDTTIQHCIHEFWHEDSNTPFSAFFDIQGDLTKIPNLLGHPVLCYLLLTLIVFSF